jgi:uncharacterized protein (DUF885 family)
MRTLKLTLISVLCVLSLGARGTADDSKRLALWFEEKFEAKLQLSPLLMTSQGRKDKYDQVDDLSEEGEQKVLDWMADSVRELREKFPYEKLDPQDQVSFDLWVYTFEQMKQVHEYHTLHYVFSENQNAFALPAQLLIRFHRVDDERDMRAYITRIEGISRAVGQLQKRAMKNSSFGAIPPKFFYDELLEHARKFLQGAPFTKSPEASPLWADVRLKLEVLRQNKKINDQTYQSLLELARQALVTKFRPSYESLLAFLMAEREKALENPTGVSRHPRGSGYYQQRLTQHTTTSLSAEEIHTLGLREVERLEKEMLKAKERLHFKGSLKEFFSHLRASPELVFPDTDQGREAYLKESQQRLQEMEKKLPLFFGHLPKYPLVVKRVESFREKAGAPHHYFPGSLDGKSPATFYLHLASMKDLPKNELEVTAYHEGVPGHHTQTSLAIEMTHLPTFRKIAFYTAFTEGWGLYAETLAKEMGGYQDGHSDFGRLSLEMRRAVRLVVDTGLHAKGWTQSEAVAFYLEKTPLSEDLVRSAVHRHFMTPGRAVSYQIGKLKILELRERAQKKLGKKFDIKTFHDTILSGGALPLTFLEKRVDQYIQASL